MRSKKIKKSPYSLLNNLLYLYKELFSYEKSTKIILPLYILSTVAEVFMTAFIPASAVFAIENGLSPWGFIISVGGVILLATGVMLIKEYTTMLYMNDIDYTRIFGLIGKLIEKSLTTDYLNRESNAKQKQIGKANMALDSERVGVERVYRETPAVLFNAIGLLLFGGTVMLADFRILIVFFFMLICNLLASSHARRYMNGIMEENTELNRKYNYLARKACDVSYGKDARMYKMETWFSKILHSYIKEGEHWQKRIEKRWYLPVASDTIFGAVRDGIAYLILIHMAITKVITLSELTFMLSVVASFSGWLFGLVNSATELVNGNRQVCDFRLVLEEKDTFKHEGGVRIENAWEKTPEIEFRDVSFRYEDSGAGDRKEDNWILSHINLHIKKGEKIALVGGNGAGKTTLVKLLCGFYHPTEGEILVNGVSIEDYNIEDYFKLIGAVFQDEEAMNYTILNTVSCREKQDADMERFYQAVRAAGISEKIESLKNKEETWLSPIFSDESIKLSGGETQKLMLARCIYKNAPLIILDEPTAALDPIAESRMYEQYNALSRGKTSIFISHRLASTRFCDRILFLENGIIAEEGTHEELLHAKGRYARIYNIQSHYYREDGEKTTDMEAAYE